MTTTSPGGVTTSVGPGPAGALTVVPSGRKKLRLTVGSVASAEGTTTGWPTKQPPGNDPLLPLPPLQAAIAAAPSKYVETIACDRMDFMFMTARSLYGFRQ